MSYWDTSALVKLSVAEPDSGDFELAASTATRIVTGAISLLEARTVFWRREAENALPEGEAVALAGDLERDVANGHIVLQAYESKVEQAFSNVLEKCYSSAPPVFIRTNDALHIASAISAGESEFVTTDRRQRAAAQVMGLTVRP